MFFSVSDLELRKSHFKVALPPGDLDLSDANLRQITPLEAEGSAELIGNALGEIRIQGSLRTALETECDRCLETVSFPIESVFDLYYRPVELPQSLPGEVRINEGESEIGFYDGGGLELNDVLREQILLSMPMQRVCNDACLGICPVCGKNRDRSPCECASKVIDDRWAAFQKLNVRGN